MRFQEGKQIVSDEKYLLRFLYDTVPEILVTLSELYGEPNNFLDRML